MASFEYTAIGEGGRRVSGTLQCVDRRDAARQLLNRGVHPLSIVPAEDASPGIARWWRAWRLRVSVQELAVFTRQLASLLKAGLPVMHALTTLRKQSQQHAMTRILTRMEERISRDGGTLADALDEHPQVFDPIYRGLVRSGEASGTIVEVLPRLAKQLSQGAKLRRQVLAAFIYPLFLLVLGLAAIFVLITVVVPRFEDLFKSFEQGLPGPTRALMAVSSFMSAWWPVVLASIAGLAVAAAASLRKTAVRQRVHAMVLRLPMVGPMLLKLEVSRISRTLAALLQGGVRILEALRIAGQTVSNLHIHATFPAMIQEVSGGSSLAGAAEKAGVYPPLMLSLIRTGEETGELPEMLHELSLIYEDETEQAVNGTIRLIEPALILMMGGAIAAIVAAIMLPIFEANAMVR